LALCRERLSDRDRDILDRFHRDGATAKDVARQVRRNVQYVYRAIRRIHSVLLDCISDVLSKERER
jgi:hypothetical protein